MGQSALNTSREAPFRLYTFKQGLMSAVGHHLCFAGTATVSSEAREDGTGLEVAFECARLELLGSVPSPSQADLSAATLELPGVLPMRADDVKKILSTALNEVLRARSYPAVQWRCEARGGLPEAAQFTLDGMLSLRGREQSQVASVVRTPQALFGTAVVHPTRWEIEPYSAMFGTLRLEDRICFKLELPV